MQVIRTPTGDRILLLRTMVLDAIRSSPVAPNLGVRTVISTGHARPIEPSIRSRESSGSGQPATDRKPPHGHACMDACMTPLNHGNQSWPSRPSRETSTMYSYTVWQHLDSESRAAHQSPIQGKTDHFLKHCQSMYDLTHWQQQNKPWQFLFTPRCVPSGTIPSPKPECFYSPSLLKRDCRLIYALSLPMDTSRSSASDIEERKRIQNRLAQRRHRKPPQTSLRGVIS